MTEQYLVKKIDKPINWTVTVPGSKSMTNRALLMAALSDGVTELSGVLFSDDSRYFISSLQSLGFATQVDAVGNIERFAFYEEAKKVYAIIATGESALYANIMLQKGVVVD